MKKRRLLALVLCLTLAFSSVLSVSANSYCTYKVGNDICGKLLSTVRTGESGLMSATHTYGGFLGIGEKTCEYTYFYIYYSNQCAAGHVNSTVQDRHEYGHTCGAADTSL